MRKAFKDRDIVFGGFGSRNVCQMQVEFRQGLVQLGLDDWLVPFQLGQAFVLLRDVGLHFDNLLLDGGSVALGSGQLL